MNNMKDTKQDIGPSDQEPSSSKRARLTASDAVPASASTLRSDNQPELSKRTRSQTKLKCSGPLKNEIEHKTPSDEEPSSSKRSRLNSVDVVLATATASTPPRDSSSVTTSTIHSASQDNNNLIDPVANPASPSDPQNTDEKSYGLKATLHGITYQQKLLILTLCHAAKRMKDDDNVDCTITSEDPESGKFDDIVFRFKDGHQWRKLLIQAKHKQDTSKTITWKAFKSTDEAAPFSISKYFNSFLSLDRNESNVFVLCTNAELETKLKDSMVPYSFKTAVFSSFFESITAEVQRIDVKKMTKKDKKELYDLMINNSDFVRLTKQLAERIMNKEAVNFNDSLFNKYRPFIEKLASSIRNDKQFYNIDEKCFDVHQEFKTSFAQECRTLLGKNSKYDIWKVIRKNGIKLNITKDPTSHIHKRLDPPKKADEKQIQNFFSSFIIVSNTKHEREIPEVIINMLKCADLGLLPPEIQGSISSNIAYEKLSDWILDWMKEKNSKSLEMKDITKFFDNFVTQINFLHLEGISKSSKEKSKKLLNLDLQCSKEIVMSRRLYKNVQSWLTGPNNDDTGYNKVNIERCNYPSWHVLEIVALLQQSYENELNFLYLESSRLEIDEDKVKNVFCAKHLPLILVIDYKGEVAKIEKLEKWQSNDTRCIKIIITIEQSFLPPIPYSDEQLLLQDLTIESRTNIYKKSSDFFGTPILYKEIFREGDGLNFVSEVESFPKHLAVKRNIIEEKFNEIQHMYIERELQQCEMENDSNYYNTSGTFRDCVNMLTSIRNEPTMYYKIGKKPTNANFLLHMNEIFRALSTLNNSFSIENDLSSKNVDFDMKKKVHLIFNDAGIGKSCYLTWLAWQLQSNEDCKDWWIVKLSFIEHATIFDQMQAKSPNMNELDAIRLFFELTYLVFHLDNKFDPKIKEKWETAKNISELVLLCDKNINIDESKLQSLTSEQLVFLRIFVSKFNNKKLFVLMDGFDEIAPDYKDMVLKLLEYLKNFEGICKIFVTSRPYDFRKEMADKLGDCGYYRLEQFNDKDLTTYTLRFISTRMPLEFERQSNIVLVHVRLLQIFLPGITYIPLFVPLALELLLPIVEKQLNMSNANPFEMLNDCEQQFARVSMMETLIRNKLITNAEKSGACTDTPDTKKKLKKEYEEIKKSHSVLGLYAILNKTKVAELLSHDQKQEATRYMNELKTGSEKSGIVDGVVDEVPIFVHRLFAEYFAAVWFFTNVEQDGVIDFLKRHVIGRNEMIEIKQFLDRIVCEKYDFHRAVLDNRGSKVKTLLIENPNIINETDFWGRTPLQLAFIEVPKGVFANEDWRRIVKILLDRTDENEILLKDRYFKWDVIDYAYNWLKSDKDTGNNHLQQLLKNALELEHLLLEQHLQSVQRNRRANFLKQLFTKLTLNLVYEDQLEDINLSTRGSSADLQKAKLLLEKTTSLREDFGMKESIMLQILVDNVFLKLDPKPIERFVESALTYRWVNVLHCLVKKQIITLPDETNFEHELLVLVTYMEHDEKKFREIFHKYCVRHGIPCLEENQLEPVIIVERSEKIILEPLDYVPKKNQFTNTNGIDIGTECLISRALQTNNLSIVQYLIRKTDTTVNNRLIKRIVQIHRIDCYCENINFLVKRSVDLRGIDVNGQNLLHFAVEQGQFNLVKCLIELQTFKPADENSNEKSWNAFFYCVTKTDNSPEEKMKLNIFKYMMDFTNEPPLNCFNQLDSHGKSIFYYAVENNRLIADDIIWRQFKTPLHEFNEEQIFCLTKHFRLSGTDPAGIVEYFVNKNLFDHSDLIQISKALNVSKTELFSLRLQLKAGRPALQRSASFDKSFEAIIS